MTEIATEFRVASTSAWADEVSVELVWVTPAMAQAWLACNEGNRPMTEKSLRKLVRNIEAAGGWRLVPDAVAFDADGLLINGQHRLHLIAQGSTSVPLLVARNMPSETWDATDRGKPRSISDALSHRGETNVNLMASAIRLLYRYEQTGKMPTNSGGEIYPEATLLRFFYDERPALRNSLQPSQIRGLSRTVVSVLHYCFSVARSVEEADSFFGKLAKPASLEAQSPIFKLRMRLDRDREARAGASMRRGQLRRGEMLEEIERRALTIIAFEKWMAGEDVFTHLKWTPGGSKPQPFPRVRHYPFFADEQHRSDR